MKLFELDRSATAHTRRTAIAWLIVALSSYFILGFEITVIGVLAVIAYGVMRKQGPSTEDPHNQGRA